MSNHVNNSDKKRSGVGYKSFPPLISPIDIHTNRFDFRHHSSLPVEGTASSSSSSSLYQDEDGKSSHVTRTNLSNFNKNNNNKSSEYHYPHYTSNYEEQQQKQGQPPSKSSNSQNQNSAMGGGAVSASASLLSSLNDTNTPHSHQSPLSPGSDSHSLPHQPFRLHPSSYHNRAPSQHSQRSQRSYGSLMSDEIMDEYFDLREEMDSSEHHLTSVLMNPRESMATLEALFEEGYGAQDENLTLSPNPTHHRHHQSQTQSQTQRRSSSISNSKPSSKQVTATGYTSKKAKQGQGGNMSDLRNTRLGLNLNSASFYNSSSTSSVKDQIVLENLVREMKKITPYLRRYSDNHNHITTMNTNQNMKRKFSFPSSYSSHRSGNILSNNYNDDNINKNNNNNNDNRSRGRIVGGGDCNKSYLEQSQSQTNTNIFPFDIENKENDVNVSNRQGKGHHGIDGSWSGTQSRTRTERESYLDNNNSKNNDNNNNHDNILSSSNKSVMGITTATITGMNNKNYYLHDNNKNDSYFSFRNNQDNDENPNSNFFSQHITTNNNPQYMDMSEEEYQRKLSSVPDMFLDEQYHLNTIILDSLINRMTTTTDVLKEKQGSTTINTITTAENKVDNNKVNKQNKSTSLIGSSWDVEKLTDELQGHLDVVEYLLTQQISSRSQDFFTATATFHYLQQQIKASLGMTSQLRQDISSLTTQQKGALEIPKLARKKKNLRELSNYFEKMEQVMHHKETIIKLLKAEDYMGALNFLEEGQSIIRDELSEIHCFKKVNKQLARYMDLTIELMGSSFIDISIKVETMDEDRDEDFDLAWMQDIDLGKGTRGREKEKDKQKEEEKPKKKKNASENNNDDYDKSSKHKNNIQTSSSSSYSSSSSSSSAGSPRLIASCRNQHLSEHSISLLKPRLDGLLRLCSLSIVLTRYKKRVLDAVKGVARTVVLEYLGFNEYVENNNNDNNNHNNYHNQNDLNSNNEEEGKETRNKLLIDVRNDNSNILGLGKKGTLSGIDSSTTTSTGYSQNGERNGNKNKGNLATNKAKTSAPVPTDYKSRVQAMEAWSFLECLELAFEELLKLIHRYKLVYDYLHDYLEKEMDSFHDRRRIEEEVEEEQDTKNISSSSNKNNDSINNNSKNKDGIDSSSSSSISTSIATPGKTPKDNEKTPGSKQDKMKSFFQDRHKQTHGDSSISIASSSSNKSYNKNENSDNNNNNDNNNNSNNSISQQTLTNIKKEIVRHEQTRKDDTNVYLLELQGCRKYLDETLRQVCENSQKSVASLIAVRNDVHTKLSNQEMKKLWSAAQGFITQLEIIMKGDSESNTNNNNNNNNNNHNHNNNDNNSSNDNDNSGKRSVPRTTRKSMEVDSSYLRQTLLTQAQFFLGESSESNKLSLVTELDAERWVQADVSLERQQQIILTFFQKHLTPQEISSLSSSSSTSIDTITPTKDTNTNTNVNTSTITTEIATATKGSTKRKNKKEKKEVRELLIEGNSYKIVWSCLYLLEVLARYVELAHEFPALTMGILHKISDLVSLYSSKSRKLIVEAGAIHSEHVKIKSITAKHLSLDYASLEILTCIIPRIQVILSAFLKEREKPLLKGEISRSIEECKHHQQQIMKKFKDIVELVIDKKAEGHDLQHYSWDGTGEIQSQNDLVFFDDILKSVTALHKVLSTNLPQGKVTVAFDAVNSILVEKLTYLFFTSESEDAVVIRSTRGKTKLLHEIVHLVTSMGMLRGVNREPLEKMKEVFQEKYQLHLTHRDGLEDEGEKEEEQQQPQQENDNITNNDKEKGKEGGKGERGEEGKEGKGEEGEEGEAGGERREKGEAGGENQQLEQKGEMKAEKEKKEKEQQQQQEWQQQQKQLDLDPQFEEEQH